MRTMKMHSRLIRERLLTATVLLAGVALPLKLLSQDLVEAAAPNLNLININFGAHLSPGMTGIKVGLAATGQTTNDFWNFYSRDDANGNWLVNGALPDLKNADGSVSGAGLLVSNAPGCWANGSADAMYNTFAYPFDSGNATATVTNLPAGQYDFYVYGHDGNYQLTVGGTDCGIRRTYDLPISNPPVWQEGRQYALYRGVTVGAGQAATIIVRPGQDGYAVISGMQIGATVGGTGTPPSIVTQPQSQAVGLGSNVTFSVVANGSAPLNYQWRLGGTNLAGATGSALALVNVQPADAGNYSVRVTNAFGSILSSEATLTVVQGAPGTLININFGAHLSPGMTGIKVGIAATGQSTNDFWNFYSRDDSQGNWLVNGALPDLKYADGSVSGAGLLVSNAPGCWADGSSDAMYNTYAYPFNGGNITATVTNLPAGQYDLYVYGYDGNYQLTVGGTDYGIRRTYDLPISNPPVWQEGRQYALYRGVTVGAGQAATIIVRPGQGGYAVISGMQIGSATVVTGTPPSIVAQPQSQTVGVGSNVTFSVAANGTAPLSYQWRLGGTNLAGATGSALALANVQPANAGNYSVRVTNAFGVIISSNALLTITSPPACVTPPSGLISWWRGEGNGNDSKDGASGSLYGGVTFAPGRVGQCLAFDGVNGGVNVPDVAALALT